MSSVVMQAMVIRLANYREHDRMLTLFSPEHGRIDALARGCRRPKSPLLASSELFVHGEFMLFQSKDRYTVTTCEITDSFYPLRLDHERLSCAAYVLSLCQAAVQPSQSARSLYRLLLQGLYHMAYGEEESPMAILSAFLLLFADNMGYRPRFHHCAQCGTPLDLSGGALMDIMAGGMVCAACSTAAGTRLRPEQVQWMQEILREGFPKGGQIKTDAAELVPLLRRYIECRMDIPGKAGRFLGKTL